MLEYKTYQIPLSGSLVEIHAGIEDKVVINGQEHDVLSVKVDFNNNFVEWTEWTDEDLPPGK
jgi:hypothetical protein